ncbi:MAG: hypothetical protein DRJ31_01700 [Candidatus Methanomethylicota archaeon]|uniref:HhH-GPD domain-containing protein n=1 Tax=Thermoproteota archaeon TaxID=2056631 RepID=A0A497EUL0_9CREN|nr:MAG: hypothetical protein DRJ31_01700 [Candidatus Verstraetearchaeota archaeon]
MRVEVRAEKYDLDLTLPPSFVSSLYVRVGPRHWIKKFGFLKGLRLMQANSLLIAEVDGHVNEEVFKEEVLLESGLWYYPDVSLVKNGKIKKVVDRLYEAYGGARLSISPRDFNYILTSVVLSKRTSYGRFVLMWCSRIFEKLDGDLEEIAHSDLRFAGTSYQLDQLKLTLRDFLSRGLDKQVAKLSPSALRRELLRCWGIGPKVADALILFTFRSPKTIPCDTHLKTMVKRLGLYEEFVEPVKQLCIKYACNSAEADELGLDVCPNSSRCLRALLIRDLGDLAGWFQTVCYIHGGSYCKPSKPSCEKCLLSDLCRYRS